MEQDQAQQIYRQLQAAGFDGSVSRNPLWYTSVAASMVWQAGTQREIVENAEIAASHLDWTVTPRLMNPCWHFGYGDVRKYFRREIAANPPTMGHNLTFDDLTPFCEDHDRSWRDSGSCTEGCRYRLRIRVTGSVYNRA